MPLMMITLVVNIGSGNGLVPCGTKPLSEPMLIQIYVSIGNHLGHLHNELNLSQAA